MCDWNQNAIQGKRSVRQGNKSAHPIRNEERHLTCTTRKWLPSARVEPEGSPLSLMDREYDEISGSLLQELQARRNRTPTCGHDLYDVDAQIHDGALGTVRRNQTPAFEGASHCRKLVPAHEAIWLCMQHIERRTRRQCDAQCMCECHF